jgi:hypothetical protein
MSDDASLRAALQQVWRRANLVRDAALALDIAHVRATELPGLIAALQEALTDLQLLAAEQSVRRGGTAGESASLHAEWPGDHQTAPWPPPPPEPRPWLKQKQGAKRKPAE